MRPGIAESGSPGVLLGQRIEDRVERRQPGSGSPVRTAWTTLRMASRTSSGCSSWILWPLWVAITSLPRGTSWASSRWSWRHTQSRTAMGTVRTRYVALF
jgi:hypothetical protein